MSLLLVKHPLVMLHAACRLLAAQRGCVTPLAGQAGQSAAQQELQSSFFHSLQNKQRKAGDTATTPNTVEV